ncbi:MAG: sulfurtransferase [Solirubrobacteraceae bacterium]
MVIALTRPLVTAARLAEALAEGERPPVLLDVRWDLAGGARRDLYEQGHIPGASFVDLDTDLAGPPGPGGRHPLPGAAQFEAAMRRAGVRAGSEVVVYDAANSTAAARGWWLLRFFGHDAVSVLDGGLAAWTSASGRLERGPARPAGPAGPAAEDSDFLARPGAMPVLDARGAAELAASGVLLDARAPERFRGETEPVDPVAGHIPGALNRPTLENVGADGHFLAAEALRDEFGAAGVLDRGPVGAYCGSGVTAAHEVLALEVAGLSAALYPGSWSEWITDPQRPVATGDRSQP